MIAKALRLMAVVAAVGGFFALISSNAHAPYHPPAPEPPVAPAPQPSTDTP